MQLLSTIVFIMKTKSLSYHFLRYLHGFMLELDYFLLIYCNRSSCIYPQFLVYPQFLLLPTAPFIRPAKQNPDPAFIPISAYQLNTCLHAADHGKIKLNEEDGSPFNFKIDKWKRTFSAAHVLWCPHQMYCDVGITHLPSEKGKDNTVTITWWKNNM